MDKENIKKKSNDIKDENVNISKALENNIDNSTLTSSDYLNKEQYVQNSEMINFKKLKNICNSDLEKCVCKIKIQKENNKIKMGTGFFCQLEKSNIKLLMTNNHIIDDSFLSTQNEIELEIDNIVIIIDLKIARYKYTNIEFDFTIIEIVKHDNISQFLTVNESNIYKDEQIFSIHYPRGKDLMFSFGKIVKKNNDNLIYSISTDFGSSGCPLILLNDLKVIGIHTGYYENDIYNNGLSMEKIIKESNVINKSLGDFYSVNWKKNENFFEVPISFIKEKSYFTIKITIKNDGNLNFSDEIILKSENSENFQAFQKINPEDLKINEYLEVILKINILINIKNNITYKIRLNIISLNDNIIIKNNNFDISISFLEEKKIIDKYFPNKYLKEIRQILEKEYSIILHENDIQEIIETNKLYKEQLNINTIYNISQKIWEIFNNN